MKPDPGAKPPSRRWRRWLKRGLWTGFWLLLVLIIFHRPILRFVLQRGAPLAAESGGMKLEWKVDGSVIDGLDLKGVTVTGDSTAPLQKLTAEHVRAEYSLWRLARLGPGQFVDGVVLEMENVDLVLDTNKFPPPETKAKKAPSPLPKIVLPKLRLQNVNARIILRDGEVMVRGLNFSLNPNASGVLEFEELLLPGNLPALRNVSGITQTETAKVTFKSLNLLPELKVQELSVDLGDLEKSRLAFAAALTVPGGAVSDSIAAGGGGRKATAGQGEVSITGSLEGLGKTLAVDAAATLTNLTPASLQSWISVPPDIFWTVPEIKATVSGEVNNPRKLKADVTLRGAGITVANVKLDSVRLDATLENGALNLRRLDLATGENHVIATAVAQLPETWRAVAKTEVKAQADVNIPQLAAVFTKDAPLSGAITGTLDARLADGILVLAQAKLTGSQWLVQGVPVESVELTASSDGKTVKVEKVKALLDAQNTVEATATLGFDAAQPLQASWTIDLPNLERFSRWSGREGTPGPDGGWLKGAGSVAGNLADWRRRDFSKTISEVKLDGSNVAWKTGRMESLTLNATAEAGRATLQNFAAVLNGRNRITATGGGALAAPWEFAAKVDGDLNQLADFEGWLKALGVKGPIAGSVKIAWEGSGKAEDLSIIGGGSVSVESFRIAEMKEAASLNLKASHTGRRADISVLEAAMGDLRISAPCTVTDKMFEIPSIRVTSGKLTPVEGRVRVPLDFTQQNGPAGPVAASGNLDMTLNVKGWNLGDVVRAAGQKFPLKGTMDADVKISGTVLNPSADITVNLQQVSSPDVKQKLAPADATVKVTLKDGKLAANAEVTQKPLQTLRAAASLPLNMQKLLKDPDSLKATPLEADVTLPDSDLNGLRPFIEGVASMKGNLGLTAKISGTIGKPAINGELHALAPAVTFKKEDVPDARNVKVRIRFDGTRVFIEEAGAMLAGGTVGARGSVDWTDYVNPKIDATLTAREALVLRDDSISMRADADITCRGSLQQATVAGKVELVRGRVFKEIEFLPLSLPNQLPPAPPAVTVGSREPPSLPPPFDKWNFNVDITTRDPIRLLGNVLNGGVISDLHLRGSGGMPVLEGKASLKDARVRLPFSRLTISRGDVIFSKDKPFQPTLDVQGDSFVNGYQVTLNAYGSALDPKIRFTSSPPLPEGEIAALLATGSTSGDLKSGEGEAANRAAFLLVSQMYRKLFRKGAMAQADDTPPRLSFNFSLLNSSSGQGRSFSAVYEINKNLQATGSMSQRGTFRGLLYYLIRFR